MSRWIGALLAAVVVVGAGACGGAPVDDTGGPEQVTRAAPTPTPPREFAGVRREPPAAGRLRNDPGLYGRVALDDCTKVKGGWRAGGTVLNDTDARLDYSILVFFTDAQARTVAFARTGVEARAGKTARWTATRTFETPTEVGCVVRAVAPGR